MVLWFRGRATAPDAGCGVPDPQISSVEAESRIRRVLLLSAR